jgi:nucleotide-binding universal stress UspA family protein
MEKILLALDAQQLNTNTIDFACYIAKLTHSKLTGLFLENILQDDLTHVPGVSIPTCVNRPGSVPASAPDPAGSLVEQEYQPADPVSQNIRRFKESCVCRETSSLIHRDRGIPLSEVLEESRFADLIIVDPVTSFSRTDRDVPSRFVKDVLLDSECPVLMAPYSFDAIEKVIFMYDGAASSVFAIKQFTYLFPALSDKKAIVVNVRNTETNAIEQQFKMKEWLKAHYQEVEFVVLKGDPSDEIFGYLIEKKNAMVVMGAFGRPMLSRFFKPSHAQLIVKTINLPVFIAHH